MAAYVVAQVKITDPDTFAKYSEQVPGVVELQVGGVQEVPSQAGQGTPRITGETTGRGSIEGVPDHGVLFRTEMDPDLVSAAGLEVQFQQGEPGKSLQHPIGGVGRTGLSGPGGHPDASDPVPADGAPDLARFPLNRAVHQGDVFLGHLPGLELPGQPVMAEVVPGNDHQARGLLVETVHDAGPLSASRLGKSAKPV